MESIREKYKQHQDVVMEAPPVSSCGQPHSPQNHCLEAAQALQGRCNPLREAAMPARDGENLPPSAMGAPRWMEEGLSWELSAASCISDICSLCISSDVTLEAAARKVLEGACRLTGSSLGRLAFTGPGEDWASGVLLAGTLSAKGRGKAVFTAAAVDRESEPFFIPKGVKMDFSLPHCINQYPGASGWFSPLGNAAPLQNHLFAPVVHGERTAGGILLGNREEGYTDRDMAAICRIAHYFSLVVHRILDEERMRKNRKALEQRMEAQSLALVQAGQRFVRACEEKRSLENQLIQAQKMEALGALAGGIAHDFNNILSVVIGYAGMALDEAPDNALLREQLQEVLKAGDRAQDLVAQILAFSRHGDNKRVAMAPRHVALEALTMLRAVLPSSIKIIPQVRSRSSILADPTQVHQVIVNLCTNAAQAMGPGGGVLELFLRDARLGKKDAHNYPGMLPGKYVKLSVKDSGPGVPQEIRDRIFEPFFTTKQSANGTGLGLAMVRSIALRHGGGAFVSSVPEKGSCFDVFFPTAAVRAAEENEWPVEIPRGRERILFVDDEMSIAVFGKMALEKLGYQVVFETSSIAALQSFTEKPDSYDLIITDMTMPEIMGDILAEKVMAVRPDIPVVLCTGFSEKMTEQQALSKGVAAYIAKPLKVADLARIVRSALDQRKDEKMDVGQAG